jgi:putative transposase
MRAPFTQLYLHCVWATWDRLLLITPHVEDVIYASIHAKSRELKCEVLALGGMADHLHLLVRFPTTLSVADLVKSVKGTSSHLQTQQAAPGNFFKWQGGYGAFTVSPDIVPSVTTYILNQKRHHADGKLWTEWEETQTPEMPPAE